MIPMKTSDVRERIGDRLVVASVSGGKDSAALSLHLRELGIEHRRVFMDTGWEHEKTYEYLRGELTRVIGPIEEIRGPKLMEELIRTKGMFPTRKRRYCTTELKLMPMVRHMLTLGGTVINAIGIRADESAERAKMREWEHLSGKRIPVALDCEVWRPLLTWTMDDVVAIHRRHGLRPNPLYLQGASRVGCWPCIMARKGEIRMIANADPARIDRLRVLEAEVGEGAHERWERDRAAWTAEPPPEPVDEDAREEWEDKHARLFERLFTRPSWFQTPNGRFGTMPIDEVVKWSRTSRGGRQYEIELFAPGAAEEGCMRWGLCETPSTDPEAP